jgi:hypothetical protein
MNLESALCLRTAIKQLLLCSSRSAAPLPASHTATAHAPQILQRYVHSGSLWTRGCGTAITSPSSIQSGQPSYRWFHTTNQANHLMKLTRCRVVDNSPIGKQAMAEGKPPKIIHIYNMNKQRGGIGKSKVTHILNTTPI